MASGEKGAGEKNVRVVQAAAGEKSPRLGIGLDIGSTATKLVVLGADGAIAHTDLMPTGFSSVDAAARALASLEAAGLVPGEGVRVVATGYGRVAVPYADKVVTISQIPNKFEFVVESTGSVRPLEILKEAIRVLEERDLAGILAEASDKCIARAYELGK